MPKLLGIKATWKKHNYNCNPSNYRLIKPLNHFFFSRHGIVVVVVRHKPNVQFPTAAIGLEFKVNHLPIFLYRHAERQLDQCKVNDRWESVVVMIAFFVSTNYTPRFVLFDVTFFASLTSRTIFCVKYVRGLGRSISTQQPSTGKAVPHSTSLSAIFHRLFLPWPRLPLAHHHLQVVTMR